MDGGMVAGAVVVIGDGGSVIAGVAVVGIVVDAAGCAAVVVDLDLDADSATGGGVVVATRRS
jgi:hypothetical protein